MNVRAKNDITAAPAVAAVGSAFRDEFFPAKTHATAAAVTSLRQNFDAVDEHGER